MANDITEFEEIDPLEIHLVGTPASKFAALMAKSTEKGTKKMKKSAMLKQLKALQKQAQQYPSVSSPHTTGVNLAGAGSTIGKNGTAERVVASFLAGLEDKVTKAQGDVATAGSTMERMRATSELQRSLRQRLLGKLVVKDGIEANRAAPLRGLGRPIFGTTFTLPDDDGLGFTGSDGQAVR